MVKFLIHRPKWIVAVAGVLIFWLTQTEWLQSVQFWQHAEGKLVNNRYLLRGGRPPDPDIRLVGLATSSFQLDALAPEEIAASPTLQLMQQPWPWDRKVYAAVLEKLMGAGAKVVVFDFVFASETDGDDEFARALQKYKDHVVIGEMFADEKESETQTKKMITPNNRLLLPGTESIPGLVTMWPDDDGVIRHVRYRTSIERESLGIPNLDPRIAAFVKKDIATGKVPDDLKHFTTLAVEKFDGKPVAVTDADFHLIDFAGGASTYRPLPIENMFVPALWQKRPFNNGLTFSNKIVVVGPTAEIFHDIHTTPFGETPGPEVQAQIIGALLHGKGLTETSNAFNIMLALVAMVLALVICLGIPQALLKGLLLTGATVAFFAICQFEFTKNNLVIQMMPPLFCLLVTGLFGIIFEYTLEQLDKRRYRNVLDRYVSKNVAKTILDDRRSFVEALKGRKQPVTVLFSDIRGFTTMTESSDADKLVAQLNEYFRDMVGSVLQHNGTLQKFIGDAIMAVWGDTHTKGNAEDARGAVTTALQMRVALAKLNTDWTDHSDRKKLSIGIGVNHGEVIVGNIGHPQRMEFTVLGDGVNLAARLESATKQFHTDILIGEEVEKLTREHFVYRTVDLIAFKGKTKPIETFTLLSDSTVPPPAWLETYHMAVKMYRRREFKEAAGRFKFTREQIPGGDFLCEMYLSRCEAYQASPPPPDWDGSFTLSEK
ncbi:MAG TPA: adenylate/guanylate cyclase domain-containing protein [Candidatus Sulfotelmatobacter sp.]|jgi:adenylate cyclase|nr:adenylate/guanylate cyclase domain-containing protein [Candidatus Sulfotelmatobacter sp.]